MNKEKKFSCSNKKRTFTVSGQLRMKVRFAAAGNPVPDGTHNEKEKKL